MVDLLKVNHKHLFSPKKMEQDKKKNELLNFIREYRFVREEELMLHIRKSMKEVQSMCQKVELSEKIKVLLSELVWSEKTKVLLSELVGMVLYCFFKLCTRCFGPLWYGI